MNTIVDTTINPLVEKAVKGLVKELAISKGGVDDYRTLPHKVQFTVSGEAVVKKGEDYEQVIWTSIPFYKILAVLLDKLNGVTLESVVEEACSNDIDVSDLKKRTVEAHRKITGSYVKPCSGKVTFDSCEVTHLEMDCESC